MGNLRQKYTDEEWEILCKANNRKPDLSFKEIVKSNSALISWENYKDNWKLTEVFWCKINTIIEADELLLNESKSDLIEIRDFLADLQKIESLQDSFND